ncbi:S8 family peptidase [Candidatus Roizmanbacteria bacterium]|nr:MAG: S8 family peptidase [Candidatus Roizmanbacteria bacterium]
MNINILVPAKRAERVNYKPKGADFWKGMWEKFSDEELFFKRVSHVKETVNKILEKKIPFEENYYIEVNLDERSRSKTATPSRVWLEADIDLVGAPKINKLMASGKKQDLEILEYYASTATFTKAKFGENIKRKEKNIYREVFAITDIADCSLTLDRVDKDIEELKHKNYHGEIKCIVELYSNIPRSKYEHYFGLISQFVPNKLVKRDIEMLFHNLSYIAYLTISEIEEILSNCSFIKKILIYPSFKASRCIPSGDLNDVRLLPPETNEIIGILDSGVNHDLLNFYKKSNTEKYIGKKKANYDHGTFVTSRALFGDDIFEKFEKTNQLQPCAYFMDFQFLFDENGEPELDYESFKKEIESIFRKYKKVISVFNFSVNSRQKDEDISELTEFLDILCRKYDIIFINSTGNHDFFGGINKDYEDIFSNKGFDTKVKAPADGLNIITVGSIALKVSKDCICTEQGYPSPFTRKGPVHFEWRKPELVAHGGNVLNIPGKDINDRDAILASNNKVGVGGINMQGLATDRGTSASAPLITRESVYLVDMIKNANIGDDIVLKGNRANLVKAMLIHSTGLKEQVEIKEKEVSQAYGFGQPDYKRIF